MIVKWQFRVQTLAKLSAPPMLSFSYSEMFSHLVTHHTKEASVVLACGCSQCTPAFSSSLLLHSLLSMLVVRDSWVRLQTPLRLLSKTISTNNKLSLQMHTYLSTSDHTPVGPMALNHQAGTVKVDCCSNTIGVLTTLFHHMPDAS